MIFISGIIQLVLLILFIFLYIYVKSIAKENLTQTQILLSIAVKQGAIIKKNCPHCQKEITVYLSDENKTQECIHCSAYFINDNGILKKIEKNLYQDNNEVICTNCKNTFWTHEPESVKCPKCNTINKIYKAE
jgi:phage FluMu protein Com